MLSIMKVLVNENQINVEFIINQKNSMKVIRKVIVTVKRMCRGAPPQQGMIVVIVRMTYLGDLKKMRG